jgi:hypothetical protein
MRKVVVGMSIQVGDCGLGATEGGVLVQGAGTGVPCYEFTWKHTGQLASCGLWAETGRALPPLNRLLTES